MIDFKQKMQEEEKKERRKHSNWQETQETISNRKRRKTITYMIAIVVVLLVFSSKIIMSSKNAGEWFSDTSFLGRIRHLVSGGDRKLAGEQNDRINILLLGMGGKGHDGAYLTDTIILLSVKPSTKQVALISLPRDLAGPIDNSSIWRKINNINAYAEARKRGSGGEKTIQALSTLLGIPIKYYIRVDFSGFVNIINELGGVDVKVKNTFDDYNYPIMGEENNPDYYARFEHLHIEAGEQKMNGSFALKYARSRHSLGKEGSDFARARRQQLLLTAVKNKLLSKQVFLNPVTIGKLINEFNKNVSTNLKPWEIIRVWNMTKDVKKEQIINRVLTDAPGNLLVSTTGENGAFLLIPRTGNFAEIKNMVQNIFYIKVPKPIEKIEPIGNGAKIIIMNGTWITGLANKNKVKLEKYDFNVIKTGNTPKRDYTDSIVYDLSYDRKDSLLKSLKKVSQASQSFNLPDWVKAYREKNIADFMLIIGNKNN